MTTESPFTLVYRPSNDRDIPQSVRVLSKRRSSRVVRVGIWDVGALVGFLPQVIESVNNSQPVITFFQVHAAAPAGLSRSPDAMEAWLRHHKLRVTKQRRKEIRANFLANDFFPQAEHVRKGLGLNYIVGITPLKLAGNDPLPYWNYFGTSEGSSLIVSTYDLPRYARIARREFEVAVGMLVSALLLDALNPRVEHHYETRGCIFDFNEDRESIVESLRSMDIDDDCRARLLPRFRDAALSITRTLRDYDRPATKARALVLGRRRRAEAARTSTEIA